MVQSRNISSFCTEGLEVFPMAEEQDHYKIGDLSKVFSLSKNTLRYYEERGVLSPTHEDGSGYRYYDDEQFHLIGSLKKLQNMGLSVDQSRDVFSGISREGVETLMADCLEREERQARLHRYLAESLREILSRIWDTSAYGRIAHREMPEHYEIRMGGTRNLVQDRELHRYASQWLDHIFPVVNVHRLSVEDVEAGRYDPAFALSADPAAARLLELDTETPFVTFHPAQDCLHMCNCFTGSRQGATLTFHYLEQCRAMLDRCRGEGLVPLDTFFCYGLFTFLDQDGISNKIGDIYLPVGPARG